MTQLLNKNKLVAIILCFTMLFSITSGIFTEAFAAESDIPVYDVTDGGNITLPHNQKALLTVTGGGRQWQVYVNDADLWVNIEGKKGSTMELSYPLVASALTDRGTGELRCLMADGSYSGIVNLVIDFKDNEDSFVPETDQEVIILSEEEVIESTTTGSELIFDMDSDATTGSELVYEEPERPSLFSFFKSMRSTTPSTYNVVINYVFENNEVVYEPYTANLAKGSNFKATVVFPVVQGYLPYLGENTESQPSLDLNIADISEDITYKVVYKPTNVDYTVIHYLQNVDNDDYKIVDQKTWQGLTKSYVPEVANAYEGFYPLLYEKPPIAADGSTIVEVKYDRYYYLMNFDMGEDGYGTEPIYARYGAKIGEPTKPTRKGYIFKGWSLDGETIVDLPKTMPVLPKDGRTYIAVWEEETPVPVTVVFWGENADDEKYSYIKSVQLTAEAGMQFTYAENDNRICGVEDKDLHTHSDKCEYNCGKEEYSHSDSCYELNCEKNEHPAHDEACYTCGGTSHTHSIACYANVGSATQYESGDYGIPRNPKEGQVYRGTFNTYIYIKGTWYRYSGTTASGQSAPTICNQTEGNHIHTDACSVGCGKEIHTHGDACYKVTCNKEVHSHSADCGYACGKKEHQHSSACYMANAGLESNLWKFVKSDTVTVNPNGSSVVNVYYDRVNYTFKFKVSNKEVYSFTEKWGADIREKWTFTGTNGTSYSPANKDSWTGNTLYTQRIYMVLIMPSRDITFTRVNGNDNSRTFYYYVESLDNSSGENKRQFESKYYDYYFELKNDFNKLYYDEDFFELKGFTRYKSARNNGNEYPLSNNGTSPIDNLYFYYTRNVYDIEFYNPTELIKTENDVKYEADLGQYDFTLTPDQAPEKYEPGTVVFDGWYLNPECTGEEYVLSEHTMPVGTENGKVALSLYAKWAPIEHKVEFYLDENAYKADTKLSTHPDVAVAHGSKVNQLPAEPDNGDYEFIGWFYQEKDENGNTVEKAFDFSRMNVTKDMKVYGKWNSQVLKKYTILYKIQGTDTQIAAPTTGSGLAGTTKTFEAKAGTDLFDGYQEGYFPVVPSHSLTIDIEATPGNDTNVYTFWYVQKDAVPYIVQYVNEETGEPMPGVAEKVVYDNRKAVVTETFVPISGYMPDAYQKRLVVNGADAGEFVTRTVVVDGQEQEIRVHEDNIIVFYYKADTEHAYYKITHYTQNTDGKTWTEYASSQAVGDIDETYTADPLTIDGFTYNPNVEGTVVSGKLTESGLELKLYYTRKAYPYQVRYLEVGTGTQLADPKNGSGLYGQVVSENAITITNYKAAAPTSQTLNIRIETGETAQLNVITFYYEKTATFNYVVKVGEGTVSLATETIKHQSGTATGSTPTPHEDYLFEGWYLDEECTNPVPANLVGNDNKLTPQKENGVYVGDTYYAKFVPKETSLTITKDVNTASLESGESFIFNIVNKATGAKSQVVITAVDIIAGKNSVKIAGLKPGEIYIVSEVTDWSWRYSLTNGNGKEVTLNIDETKNTVTFKNTKTNSFWLSVDAFVENIFG